jgi:hypothetical protein
MRAEMEITSTGPANTRMASSNAGSHALALWQAARPEPARLPPADFGGQLVRAWSMVGTRQEPPRV